MKKLLVDLWNRLFDVKRKAEEKLRSAYDYFYSRSKPAPCVMTIEDTVETIIKNGCSVSRFGDGEAKLAAGTDISFQRADPFAVNKLREVLSSDEPFHLVCLPDVFESLSYMDNDSAAHWKKHLAKYRRIWYSYIKTEKQYGNAFMSRCYMLFNDKSKSRGRFDLLRKIWDGRDILIVEGEKSRLGVGNDLFDNAASVKRILGPVSDAFSKYGELLRETVAHAEGRLILLALGPAATGLAFDLYRDGFQAIDIGHVDIEYEWFLSGVKYKTPVKNKYVNEAGAGKGVGGCDDEKYLSEIILRITD